jgi:hypothetical protein
MLYCPYRFEIRPGSRAKMKSPSALKPHFAALNCIATSTASMSSQKANGLVGREEMHGGVETRL